MIYLIDTIGTETGMHLYDQSFRRSLEAKGQQVTLLSNFDTPHRRALFPNFYHGGRLLMMLRFAWSLLCMLCFYLGHHKKEDIYVYQSFGLRTIDQLFIRMLCGYPRLFIIAHDLFEITGQTGADPNREKKSCFYNRHIPHIVCHSRDTERDLKEMGYKGSTFYFPHFSYEFSKEINEQRVAQEVRDAWSNDRINFLFFGQIRETKGILILQEAIRLLEHDYPEFAQMGNIIIAGMDKGELISHEVQPSFVHSILRYMDDNELNWLFSRQPYTLLPYTEIYQSGVLEVVIYFRCPSLMSDIPFFRQMLEEYPSFGQLYAPNTPKALAEAMLQVCTKTTNDHFLSADIHNYQSQHDCQGLCDFFNAPS